MFAITASQASNAVVTFEGDGEAKVRSMYRMVMKIDGGAGAPTYMEAQGAYADTVVRTVHGWKLADRYEHLLYVR